MNSPWRHSTGWIALLATFLLIVIGGSGDEVCAEANALDIAALARLQSPPLGLPAAPVPADNPATVEKIALGRKLFFDRRISKNGTMSCGMCHIPEQGFTNHALATPVGINGKRVRRNAPSILNVAYLRYLFLDGREASLESQATVPLFAANEMGNASPQELINKVTELDDYRGLFEVSFGGGPTIQRIGQAIASWERTLLAGNSPFDRWRIGGQEQALTAAQKHGFALFVGKARCAQCHSLGTEDALFTDQSFHDTGIGYRRSGHGLANAGPVTIEIARGVFVSAARDLVAQVEGRRATDFGRFEVTSQRQHQWQYRTPTLRNVAVTAPYMHDGSLPTLDAVVRYYNHGATPHAGLDPLIQPLRLDEDELSQLVAFLHSLTASNLAELVADARAAAVGN